MDVGRGGDERNRYDASDSIVKRMTTKSVSIFTLEAPCCLRDNVREYALLLPVRNLPVARDV